MKTQLTIEDLSPEELQEIINIPVSVLLPAPAAAIGELIAAKATDNHLMLVHQDGQTETFLLE
jgi:hypothetical protein